MARPEVPAPWQLRDSARVCGRCTACCIHMPIPAGEVGRRSKPAGIACPRLCKEGCQDYADRPQLCVDFRCAWLADATWPNRWRPDQSGLLALREDIEEGLPAGLVYEIRAGAFREATSAEIIEQLCRTTVVVALVDHAKQRRRVTGHVPLPITRRAVAQLRPAG